MFRETVAELREELLEYKGQTEPERQQAKKIGMHIRKWRGTGKRVIPQASSEPSTSHIHGSARAQSKFDTQKAMYRLGRMLFRKGEKERAVRVKTKGIMLPFRKPRKGHGPDVQDRPVPRNEARDYSHRADVGMNKFRTLGWRPKSRYNRAWRSGKIDLQKKDPSGHDTGSQTK